MLKTILLVYMIYKLKTKFLLQLINLLNILQEVFS
jgi:hypothetical protein